jgi:putative transposase
LDQEKLTKRERVMMNDDEKKQRIATFRYGVISDFVGGASLDYGDKERLLREKSERLYEIPYSSRRGIGRATILSWIRRYRAAGCRIEGLYPTRRSDRGAFRSLDANVRMAIRQVLVEEPTLTVPTLLRRLKQKQHIPSETVINKATVYRFIEKEGLREKDVSPEDRRKFEAAAPNDLWQSDVMHGPRTLVNGVRKKTYLVAIIDDHSRMIMHAAFYSAESLDNFEDALRQAVVRWGLPQKLYTDNGGCFRAHHLEFVTAALGISLRHARPYKPQGKGKIERWFRTVRQEFLPDILVKAAPMQLSDLNQALSDWVEVYNGREHSSTEQTPIARYRKGIECVRPAPPDLLAYFREVERRLVRKDRTVLLEGRLFEIPTALIDKRVELRFQKDEPEKVEIFYEGL